MILSHRLTTMIRNSKVYNLVTILPPNSLSRTSTLSESQPVHDPDPPPVAVTISCLYVVLTSLLPCQGFFCFPFFSHYSSENSSFLYFLFECKFELIDHFDLRAFRRAMQRPIHTKVAQHCGSGGKVTHPCSCCTVCYCHIASDFPPPCLPMQNAEENKTYSRHRACHGWHACNSPSRHTQLRRSTDE